MILNRRLIVFPEHHGSFLAQASPAGHELQLTAHGSIIEQEEQQQEEAGVDGPAVNLADADFHHLGNETLDEAVEGERLAAERHTVDSGTVACHVVGYVIRQSACIESCSHDSAHNHMQHIEYAQCLKEVAKGHNLFQTYHERGAQDGIGETSAQRRQEELRDVNVCRKDEIEREQVACQ